MPDQPPTPLRSLSAPRPGALILACRKCQKKLRRSGPPQLAKLKKSLRKLGKGTGLPALQLIDVPCFKLCPKNAVTVCAGYGLTTTPPTLSLLRTAADIATLADQATRPPAEPRPAPAVTS